MTPEKMGEVVDRAVDGILKRRTGYTLEELRRIVATEMFDQFRDKPPVSDPEA